MYVLVIYTYFSWSGISLQQRLLEISNSLSDVELRQMKFLAKPRLDAFRLAKIREGFELFEELDASGLLSCTYVRELLEGIQRFDLLERLDVPLLCSAEGGKVYILHQYLKSSSDNNNSNKNNNNNIDNNHEKL